MANTTITDIPRRGAEEQDKFGLLAYERGLEAFLRGASTPITVALQGEWGSGKTSLMNVLRDDLCGTNDKEGEYYSVWINTWEYSLMKNSNEALLQILVKMASEVISLSRSTSDEVINSFKKAFMGVGSAIMRNMGNKVADGLGDGILEALCKDGENSIADLRGKLQIQINECLKKNNVKKGIIFFIDDLDRIDPPVAVELLELLKNVFTLEHCIFVLAIDYDVVIKGLKPKFGELNEKNEREFRSFFDKIIQVPFSMPVSQYSTKDYIIDELKKIGILDSSASGDVDLLHNIELTEQKTIGPNPRSIKRFLNTLSLIKCINDAKQQLSGNKGEEKEISQIRKLKILLNLAIVGIQVAYPKVYQLLCLESGFTMWNDAIASKMGIPHIDEQTKERLKKDSRFDEDWELVLYRLCQTDKYLNNNALSISELLNLLRERILDAYRAQHGTSDSEELSESDIITDFMNDQMSQTAVTGFSAGDKTQLEYDKKKLMRDITAHLCRHVGEVWKDVNFKPKRVVSTAGGINTDGDYSNMVIYQNQPENHKIRLQFRLDTKQVEQTKYPEYLVSEQYNEQPNQRLSELKEVSALPMFVELMKTREELLSNNCYYIEAERRVLNNGRFYFQFWFDVIFDDSSAFFEPRSLQTMKNVTKILFDILFKFHKM